MSTNKPENKSTRSQDFVSLKEARKQRFKYDFNNQPPKPKLLGRKVIKKCDLNTLKEYIDWTPFFKAWGLNGKYPRIFDHPKKGESAKRVFDDAQNLLDEIIENKWIQPQGVIGIYPANSKEDDILIYKDDNRDEIIQRIPMLRQQRVKNKSNYYLSLSDYVAPESSGVKDYFGGFAITSGLGIDKYIDNYNKEGDVYNSVMFRLLADRLVEAYAEIMHERVRKQYWAYEPHENLSNEELIKEQYNGIRPAPGYPACPDHTLKGHLFELLEAERLVGIQLTHSYAMRPTSSISGFYLAHNTSKYFGIHKIDRDQLVDYAKRAQMKIEDAEKWLNPLLDNKKFNS